ncbi:uncharacterized protein LOC113861618 [Abrus precatorius]|uniref:Uncharacterized protein LOC113861618 n=1 Tax=Abrus precatorius TaxID=3816 RepID=A0A8B8L2G5_ABRPR|nr:uncharacterized protein LOC113861618 [Abrus precatorius]
MEAETRRKIEEMVLDILKKSDMGEATEFTVRVAASERLGIDLSDTVSKQFVRTIVDSFLLSLAAEDANKKPLQHSTEPEDKPLQDFIEPELVKPKKEDFENVICQLSNRRNVIVHNFKGMTLVSIREFYNQYGKQYPGYKGISLSTTQWSIFKKSVPAVEEAIKKMERRLRSELHGKENEDASDSAVVAVAPLEPVTIDIIRFDGNNYQFWAQQMQLLLKQLKIGYVLTELCPNATLGGDASAEEIATAKTAEKRWVNDDLMCRRNILTHLSDHLFNQYASRKMSAKELWEELKLIYLYEECGTKRSQVKKYIEFQMVDERAVVEQIQELNSIADSIVAAGMHIDDNFHVSVIISKLPPSWKDFCFRVIHEDCLSLSKLMERIQTEEESRKHSSSVGFHHASKGGQRWFDNKPTGMYRNRSEINAKSVACSICGKSGHLSKNCWRRYDKQANERKAEEDKRTPAQVDTPVSSYWQIDLMPVWSVQN